jgi:hypothetical protein
MHRHIAFALSCCAFVVLGCGGGGGPKECKLDDAATCASPLTCATIRGKAKPICVQPVHIEGRVITLGTSQPIAAALVTAVDENGAPVASVTTSAADGTFSVRVPHERSDGKGTPIARKILLRGSAKDYVPFPSGVRVSLPIETSVATRDQETKPFVVKTSATDIALAEVAASLKGRPSISGTVVLTKEQSGALVVADTGVPAQTAISDTTGTFNLQCRARQLQPSGIRQRSQLRSTNNHG